MRPTRCATVALLALACVAALGPPAADAACPPAWSSRTLVSGRGWLENLVFDPHRGLFVPGLTAGKILHVSPSGSTRVLIDDVHTPGGLRIRRGFLYFNTGDDASSGVGNVAGGTIDRYRFRTKRRTTWAS